MGELIHNNQGKIIGEVEGQVFKKPVDASIHQLRKPPAWGIDEDIFRKYIMNRCHTIQITDRKTAQTWTCSVDTFRRKGFLIDRGYNKQVVLPLFYWTVEGTGQMRLST